MNDVASHEIRPKPTCQTVPRTLVILPTFCEAGNIEVLVQQIFDSLSGASIIVIDDGSPDGTARIATDLCKTYGERLKVVEREQKAGVGSALKVGFRVAENEGFDFAIQMDADLSHDPTSLRKFVEATKSADIVVGSRLVPNSSIEGRLAFRNMVTSTASLIGRSFFHMAVKDMSSGFKCWTRRAFEAVEPWHMKSDSFSFQIECNVTAARLGLKIVEIPIDFKERNIGKSKADSREFVNSAKDAMRLMMLDAVRARKLKRG